MPRLKPLACKCADLTCIFLVLHRFSTTKDKRRRIQSRMSDCALTQTSSLSASVCPKGTIMASGLQSGLHLEMRTNFGRLR